jgi:predicted DNA-binding transcriptional regulator YafY
VRQIPVEHEIAPYALVAKGQAWYVVWRRRNGELRVDLASDVIEAELMDETFSRARGFDLAEFWTKWAAAYEVRRWFFPVTLRAMAEVLPHIERNFGRHIRRTAHAEQGSMYTELEMVFDHFEHARAALLAYGGAVEVIEPDALRLSIADFARQIVEMYE